MTKTPNQKALRRIELLSKMLNKKRAQLNETVRDAETEMAAVREKHSAALRRHAKAAATVQRKLLEIVQENPELFAKPKTRVWNDVKVGFRKQSDKLVIPDRDACVKRIKEKLPDEADLLIKTTSTPVLDALKRLDRKKLKKIGVHFITGKDEAIALPVDSEIDKKVDALLAAIEGDIAA